MRTTGEVSEAIASANISYRPCTVNLPASASELIALILTHERVTEVKAVGISAAGNIRGKRYRTI